MGEIPSPPVSVRIPVYNQSEFLDGAMVTSGENGASQDVEQRLEALGYKE